MTLEQSENKEDYKWLGGLKNTSHVLDILCLFVVILYVISYHSTNLVGPRSREGAALMPTSGPFLYETQDQALFRAQSQNYWSCALVQYITVATKMWQILIFLQVAFAHLIK